MAYRLLPKGVVVSHATPMLTMGRLLHNRRGFTLAETVIAVVILGITLGAGVMGYSMAMKTVYTGRNQIAALHYARDEMEGLRTYSFSNSVLNAGTRTISNATYTGYYTVTNLDSATKNIALGIYYKNSLRGGNSTNILTTTFTDTIH